MDNESSYNCSFLFSSLVDDHDPDSQDNTYNKSEANSNSNSNSLNNTSINPESKARKRPRNNNDGHSEGFNPKKFFHTEPKYNKDDDFYISPAALNANTTLEDVLITKTNIFNQPPAITEINEQCEIFTNDRGTVKLCIDGCLYIKNMKSGSTCYWQCVQKNLRNCHGCAVTYAVGEKHYLKRIRREHTHDPVALNTRGFSQVYQMQMKNLKENLSDCRFTKNRWGNPKLVLDGYFYVRHNNAGESFYWKCEQRGQCEACVVTHKNLDGTHKLGRIIKEHTHQPKNENDIKELRLSYIPKFSQSHLDQINKSVDGGENKSDIPHKKINKTKIGQTTIKPVGGAKGVDEGDSSSSMSLYSSNMPKLLTLKSSCDQNDEQIDSDNSQTTSQFTKKTEKTFSRQSSITSISQSSAKSSMTANDTNNFTAIKTKKKRRAKLEFKKIEFGEKCEFVFLIDGIYKMLLNGFAYELAKGSDGKSAAVWRCSGHSRIFVECNAIAETIVCEGDHYLKATKGHHSHPPCDEDVDDNDDDEDLEADYNEQEDNFDEEDYSIDHDSPDNFEQEENFNSSTQMFSGADDGKCEFIITKRGLPKLTREGYYYVRNSVNKNRSEITYWKCELKGKCTGTLVTCTQSDGYYVKSSKGHNHLPDPHKYTEPRFDKPDQVIQYFTEADSQNNEDSSDEMLITPENESKFKISNNKNAIAQDPLAEDPEQNAIVSVKTTARSTDIKLDLITTARGMPKIARNGYYYCKSSVNKNRQEITYWKCELKGQCKGFLISITKSDGYYFKSERTHSHPPDPDKYRSMRKSSFEELNNSFGTSFVPKINSVKRENYGEKSNVISKQMFNPSMAKSASSSANSGNSHNRMNPYQQIHRFKEEMYPEEVNSRSFENFSNNDFDNRKVNRNGQEELPLIPEDGDPNMTYECEFIISCQGNPKLCLNGYMYTKNRDKNTNFYWNCEIKKSRHCMGYCVTEVRNGKHIVKKIRAHNHEADLRREMLSKKLSNILQKVYAKPLWNPRKIIDYELSKLPEDIRRQLPKAYSIQRMVKRKVQEKVSTVRQSLLNGEYAPIPNMEPSTSKQPQSQQHNRNIRTSVQTQQRHPQYRNPYSGRFESAPQVYNDEYNFNNLYNSNNRSNSSNNYYQRDMEKNDVHEEYDQHGGYNDNQMDMGYNDPSGFRSSSNFNEDHEHFGNDDVYNCEIKNEPIDDYGYQNYEGEFDEQMDLSYDNNTGYHESMDAADSWNDGSAFDNSYINDEAYDDNYENYDDGNRPTTTATATSYNSNAESSNSSQSSTHSKNSEEYHSKQENEQEEEEQKKESLNSQSETQNSTTNSTNPVVYKKNQIAKKRIRAPDIINN